jgi:hypothetical protein
VDARVTQEYLRFCEALGQPGDCRQALMNSPVLTGDGRYALAMSFAIEEIVPEMMQAFKDMADPEAIKAALYWTMALYAAMWLALEPVFSKGLATVLTATFDCYVGVDTLWTLIQGFRRMVEELEHAASFSAIREAGKRYGKVMGRNAARAFALLLTAAIGQTAASFSAKVPTLPGSAQASASGARMGIQLTEVAQVESVVVTADAVTIALASNAVAMTGQGLGSGSKPENQKPQIQEQYKTPKSGVSGKEGAKDVPSWAKGQRPKVNESGKDFAKRLLDEKYGEGNYDKGPGSEFNKIQKWGDRAFENP